ncbi:MAG: sigma-54 dependent transcriptional regulator [Acidobacteriota bacterium]
MARNDRILVVEDRPSLRRLMTRALEQVGYAVVGVEDVESGRARLAENPFDLVLTDLKLGDGTGLDILAASKACQPETPVVVVTAFGTVQAAVEAMKLGAVDFLEKPLEIDELYELIGSHLRSSEEPPRLELFGSSAIVGNHPLFLAALRLLKKVAPTESTVLITGESGTGKELFARAAHALSKRSKGPFIAVNCAAIPDSLIENELFGHQKGAFTGAHRQQSGRFEQAAGGTIFLDEIGELKLDVQGKVLRVLEERAFERVGGGRTRSADVRIVAATNRDLRQMVDGGEFRQDLFYRLDVFPVVLPPLRDRSTDIPHLARYLVDRLSKRMDRTPPDISPEVMDLLIQQPWPGNVRELANALERSLILSEGSTLRRSDFLALETPSPGSDDAKRFREALVETQGDKQRAAALLGVSYRTFQRRVKQLDLEGFPKYRG